MSLDVDLVDDIIPFLQSVVLFQLLLLCLMMCCLYEYAGLQNLALDMDASNQGLKVLLQGCTGLKSLHIGSRCVFSFYRPSGPFVVPDCTSMMIL